MKMKTKYPEAISDGKRNYIRQDVIVKAIHDMSKAAVRDFRKQYDASIQERLDSGEDVDVREEHRIRDMNMKNIDKTMYVMARYFEECTTKKGDDD